MSGRVWTASQYVDELRRRRDEARASAHAYRGAPGKLAFDVARLDERALVYEECAALADLTADPRARGPVLDALAVLHKAARALAEVGDVECVAGMVAAEDVADASRAVDAALAARSTLPETVTVAGLYGAECDQTWDALSIRCPSHTRFRAPVHRQPECRP